MIPSNSNWIMNNLLVGGLPRTKKDFDSIKEQGINVFVNLMNDKEAKKGKKKPMFDYRETDHTGIRYLHVPIKDLFTISDDEMINVAKKVVNEIQNGNKVYIHCYGGHGRTGTLAGIVLHFLYPDMTYEEVLKHLNNSHKTRVYKPNETTPQTAIQFNQLHRIITGKNDIFFYLGENDPNFIFSNYYQNKKTEFQFEIMNNKWISNESFFQSMKYTDNDYKKLIQEADTSHKAFLLGRMGGNIRPEWVINKKSNQTRILNTIKTYKNKIQTRHDWDNIKDKVMIIGLFAKFTQNEELYNRLLSTGNARLVEYSPVDKYWGTYWDKVGQNKLGQCLMKVRDCLRLNINRNKLSTFSKQFNWKTITM